MKNRALVHLSALLLLIVVILAVTPEAESASRRRSRSRARRSGLEQRVTITAVGQPLGTFLKELSSRTRVKMTASPDVADVKVAVLARALPLSQLQTALKDVLRLQVVKVGTGRQAKYESRQDPKTVQTARLRKQQAEESLKAYMNGLAKDYPDKLAQGIDPLDAVELQRHMTVEELRAEPEASADHPGCVTRGLGNLRIATAVRHSESSRPSPILNGRR